MLNIQVFSVMLHDPICINKSKNVENWKNLTDNSQHRCQSRSDGHAIHAWFTSTFHRNSGLYALWLINIHLIAWILVHSSATSVSWIAERLKPTFHFQLTNWNPSLEKLEVWNTKSYFWWSQDIWRLQDSKIPFHAAYENCNFHICTW
jgi:hypothetical protein